MRCLLCLEFVRFFARLRTGKDKVANAFGSKPNAVIVAREFRRCKSTSRNEIESEEMEFIAKAILMTNAANVAQLALEAAEKPGCRSGGRSNCVDEPKSDRRINCRFADGRRQIELKTIIFA